MSYVDAFFDKDKDKILIVERNNGKRDYKEQQAKYTFYYKDPRGKYKSIYGEPLTKVVCKNTKEFNHEKKLHSRKGLYESDLNPVFSFLSDTYLDKPAPKLNVAFFDIEVAFDQDKGYAPTDDPFNPITAISVHLQWLDSTVCLAVPPKTLTQEQATELIKDIPNVILFEKESEMLTAFLDLIDDVDVIGGWNSSVFDLPYIIGRIMRVLSKDDTRKLCLFGQLPKKRYFEHYGADTLTYDLVGRVHLDNLDLYQKFTYEERHSYSLDAIAEYELHERKIPYNGTLDHLYNHDFKKFVEYNIQDTVLLNKLDKKLKFIDLANTIAHDACVLLPTTLGTIQTIEQSIINETHKQGLVIPDRIRKSKDEDERYAGAYVAYPKKGIHRWVGSLDVNSLYPSTIRAINMSPECLVGQIRPTLTDSYINSQLDSGKSFAAAWEGMFGTLEYDLIMNKDKATSLIIDWEDGTSAECSGAEIYKLIFESGQPWMISANGTIFTYEKEGIIPTILKKWHSTRTEYQANLKGAKDRNNELEIEYWDKRQLVEKLKMNSSYGALSNSSCRFYDKRIGQSTTLSGRQVVKHMAATINELITGEYNHVGDACLYSDTDSEYFSAYKTYKPLIDSGEIEWTKDSVIKLYNDIGKETNKTFPEFMKRAFNCPLSRGEVIKAGREIVGTTGLFITKKRYAIMYYDKDNKRVDSDEKIGKIKATGLDLKRSDTPVFIQSFLTKVLELVLTGAEKNDIIDYISKFRDDFRNKPGWEIGSPKRANNIASYQEKEEKLGKANMPGHVRAAINWNTLKRIHKDKYTTKIVDGAKVIVCKLKRNQYGYTSVAYPVDELRLPDWFKELPFDTESMEESLIDDKLENLIGVLHWDLSNTKATNTFGNLFNFS